EYRFNVREGGEYTWWIRLNPFQIKHRYAMDGARPKELEAVDVRERINVLTSGIDVRFLGWVKAAKFHLDPGSHSLVLQVEAGPREAHGGIDCMALVNFPWAPTGTEKPRPGEREPAGPDTWFPIVPDDDEFSEESITDVSHLVHRPAGKHGFLQAQGDHFVFADRPGEPVKFWGMCAGPAQTPELQRQQARFYVKHGINMIRKHTVQAEIGLLQRDPRTGERRFDPERLDRFDRWFSILKEQGIYMTWSCFYPHLITRADRYPAELYAELPDRGKGKSTSGLVNMMPQLQDAEWEWLKALLLHKNPYTGLRYVDDPALAIVEVHNEDCIFWHAPLNDLAAGEKFPRHTAILKRRWMEWVKERYGDDAALRRAWGNGMREGDSVSNPRMDVYGAWQMSAEGPDYGSPVGVVPAERKRMGDFIRFLAEMQRSYYERRLQRLRDVGYRACAVSTAWRAGGAAADPANIWCDSAMDLITRHNYFGGGAGGHGIAPGEVSNETHLDQVGSHLLSTGFYQVEDKPFIVTEWTQKPPNQWKAEAAPLFAFYGLGLQGWDASYHFAGHRPRMGGGWPNLRSYVTETPHYIGQFPALAFALYRGHFKEAPLAAARRLGLNEVFQGIDALSQDFTGGGYDQKELTGSLATPKEVLGIGRVTVKIGPDVGPSSKADWARYRDRARSLVSSMTGQLTWDQATEVVAIHTTRTQGIVGFAGGRRYELPGADVSIETPFVSLLFTPLDDQPLEESEHILITAMARDRQTGAEYNADGTRLLDVGKPPLLMEPVQAEIILKGKPIRSVRPADIYGVPRDEQVEREGNTFRIDGRYRAYYYEVKR
ncbi:MAG: beta-galactosidase, partial [Candidatus Brocadiaceae bacterium]